MKTRATLALTALAGLASMANAQQPSFTSESDIPIHLTWREATSSGCTVATPNNVLDTGEFALITIDSGSFTGQGNTASFSPGIGTFSSGAILGFGSAFLDLVGSGGTAGTFNNNNPLANNAGTSGFGVRGAWRLNGNGTVNPASDGIINLQFGQFAPGPGNANSATSITNMFRMLWQPASFADRTVAFNEVGAAIAGSAVASVYLDLDGGSTGASVFVTAAHLHLNGVNIPLHAVPAPGSLALLGLGGLVAGRRRRR